MDQKKLRELMKKEKEARGAAAGRPGGRKPVANAPLRAAGRAPVDKAQAAVATKQTGPALQQTAAPAAPATNSGKGLLSGYGDDQDGSDEEEEVKKRPSGEEESEAKRARTEMPPPPVPARGKLVDSSALLPAEPSNVKSQPESASADASQKIAVQAPSSIAPAAETAAEEAEEEQPQGLPEGFFDDPELDAKVRGAEAPSKIAERELEEGLKRFEREMVAETEKAEETRHDLDEQKYEAAAADEQEFQKRLHARLAALRKKTQEGLSKKQTEASAAAPATGAAGNANAEDDGEDDDDEEDVAFDWRAKGFS